jgi:putative DNA methylase
MSYYKPRALPHWNPGDAALFITWRLHGSFPAPEPEWERLPSAQHFILEDQALDKLATGPHYLRIPSVAASVAKALHYGALTLRLYDLHAWVIMSNHVHILIDPLAPLPKLTKSIKNFSAREANRILNRTGPFWQAESFDRWVRDAKEFDDIARYIEFNPVSAGLTANPEDWQWSSASVGQEAYTTRSTHAR